MKEKKRIFRLKRPTKYRAEKMKHAYTHRTGGWEREVDEFGLQVSLGYLG